jgi:hypothetical protein
MPSMNPHVFKQLTNLFDNPPVPQKKEKFADTVAVFTSPTWDNLYKHQENNENARDFQNFTRIGYAPTKALQNDFDQRRDQKKPQLAPHGSDTRRLGSKYRCITSRVTYYGQPHTTPLLLTGCAPNFMGSSIEDLRFYCCDNMISYDPMADHRYTISQLLLVEKILEPLIRGAPWTQTLQQFFSSYLKKLTRNDVNYTRDLHEFFSRNTVKYEQPSDSLCTDITSFFTALKHNITGQIEARLRDNREEKRAFTLNLIHYQNTCSELAEMYFRAALTNGAKTIIFPDFGLGVFIKQLTPDSKKEACHIMRSAIHACAQKHKDAITTRWVLYDNPKGTKDEQKKMQNLCCELRDKYPDLNCEINDFFKLMQEDDNTGIFVNPGSDRTIGGKYYTPCPKTLEEQIAQKTSLLLVQSDNFNSKALDTAYQNRNPRTVPNAFLPQEKRPLKVTSWKDTLLNARIGAVIGVIIAAILTALFLPLTLPIILSTLVGGTLLGGSISATVASRHPSENPIKKQVPSPAQTLHPPYTIMRFHPTTNDPSVHQPPIGPRRPQ